MRELAAAATRSLATRHAVLSSVISLCASPLPMSIPLSRTVESS